MNSIGFKRKFTITKEKKEDIECNIDEYPEYDNCDENGEYEDAHEYN